LILIVFGSHGEELGLDPRLSQEIVKTAKENNLILDRPFFDKILQLNQVLQNQLGVILVGQTGTGKTACWKTLKNSL
jgi:hypothetical protein